MATIRSEGGLLPADLLARVAALDRDLGGLAVSDFHLAPNERLGEAIARSWARLTAAWDAFSTDRDELQAGDHAGKPTRERWLLPLFSELGYGRLIQQSGVEIEGKTYAVFCEYNHSPVHLVGAGVPLDRRTAGVRGAADQSPHSVVQELLNRSTERLWGIVTNGLSLRLLRDNVTLTRQAYVEFDLEAIFATEAYEDFALLWLCAHQSRLEAEAPEECWLERWTQAAQRDGTRALGELRSGVERAIEALGRGFLIQPANSGLHGALRDGSLDGPAYYGELLRLIYRLLFLFVAEDRDALLLPDDGTPARFDARDLYDTHYGTKRLRRLSVRRRGGRAHDLYEQIKLLSGWLRDRGQPLLALPVLGSALWDPDSTAHISNARLGNEALLEAIRELSYVEGGRRPVDFRNLGAEELGSVYESLLELHPAIDRDAAQFALTTAAGHERKQTGSYYTPTSLIGSLLESALDPVLDAAVKSDFPEQALLDLTVCDPACGSGHFLIAAANRIAKRLAAIREHDPEPAPEAIRHALRDVVSRCIHGVDVNPMAVELCKVSLWLEALEPGRPLSFLDDRILCGNSLIGATPALVAAGVPDDAYKPLGGDDKEVVKAWRQHNARESKGQTTLRLEGADPIQDASRLASLADRQRAIADDTAAGVLARESAYAQMTSSSEHDRLCLSADTWLAAFTTPKQPGATRITTGVVQRAAGLGSDGLSAEELAAVQTEGDAYRPLHWHIAFPAIFRVGMPSAEDRSAGGFDCVLGNPPWERVKLQEKEFFAASRPDIAMAGTKAARERLIKALPVDDPVLLHAFEDAKRQAEGVSHFVRTSGRYPLCGRGDVNTYTIFAELNRTIVRPSGRVGCIVPSGIATDDTTKHFFQEIVESGTLMSLFDFENREGIFPAVDSRMKFCLLTLAGRGSSPRVGAQFVFFATRLEHIADKQRRFTLTAEDIALVNPETRTCPTFRSNRDAELTKQTCRTVGIFGAEAADVWRLKLGTLFHSSADAGKFETVESLGELGWDFSAIPPRYDGETALPLYEGKMFGLFDHRAATVVMSDVAVVRQRQSAQTTLQQHQTPAFVAASHFWVRESEVPTPLRWRWVLGFKKVTSPTNERTLIASVLPRCAANDSVHLLLPQHGASGDRAACLLANASSFITDYLARQKLGGLNFNFFVFRQMPIVSPTAYDVSCSWSPQELIANWIIQRVLELTYTAWDLSAFASDIGYAGPPFRWDEQRRTLLKCELDAAYFLLYGLDRSDVDYVLDTFPLVRSKEVRDFGEYQTKRVILEMYDDIAESARSGSVYTTRLEPPPADPSVAHGKPAP